MPADHETVRRAVDPGAADELEVEARILADVQLPGVVVLLGFRRRGDSAELRLGDADHPDLAARPAQDAASLCRLGSALARTVAEVHRAGVAHNALGPEVVLVDESGLPVLSGFSSAGSIAPGGQPDADLRDLGNLLLEAHGRLRPSDDGPELRRRRRLNRAFRPERGDTAGGMAARLAGLSAAFEAELEESDDPETSPAALDRGIRARVARTRRPAGRSVLVAAAAAALLTLAGVTTMGGQDRPSVLPAVADDAPVVEHDGQRYQMGAAGDVVLVGDWGDVDGGCDGLQTAALLRPSTGAVYVFGSWADSGVLPVEAAAVVDGADSLVADDTPGCAVLHAVGPGVDEVVTTG